MVLPTARVPTRELEMDRPDQEQHKGCLERSFGLTRHSIVRSPAIGLRDGPGELFEERRGFRYATYSFRAQQSGPNKSRQLWRRMWKQQQASVPDFERIGSSTGQRSDWATFRRSTCESRCCAA